LKLTSQPFSQVAPFCGCAFGGFLYDLFIYTGPDSPLNKPWLGLNRLLCTPSAAVTANDDLDGSEA
jgi:hypothetical protein